MLGGYIAFVSATPIQPEATAWSEKQIETMKAIYGEVIRDGYAGPRGFGSLEAWARAFGITPAPAACPGPDCCNAGGALRFMYVPNSVNMAGWHDYPDLARIPAIQTGCTRPVAPARMSPTTSWRTCGTSGRWRAERRAGSGDGGRAKGEPAGGCG